MVLPLLSVLFWTVYVYSVLTRHITIPDGAAGYIVALNTAVLFLNGFLFKSYLLNKNEFTFYFNLKTVGYTPDEAKTIQDHKKYDLWYQYKIRKAAREATATQLQEIEIAKLEREAEKYSGTNRQMSAPKDAHLRHIRQ